MKFRIALLALAVIGAIAFATSQGVTQEQPSEEEMAEGMKRWMEMSQPGPMHDLLKKQVGSWTTVSKMWMGGPGSPPMEATGTAEFHEILGGRFVQGTQGGDMMGQPFEGFSIAGYDNFRKRFVTLWMDTWGTGVFTLYGHKDREGKVITMYGQMDEIMTGEIGKMARFVTRWIDDDNFVIDAYDIALADDAKVMEIAYKRVKTE